MPTFDSDQFAKFNADPRQANSVNEWGARVRMRKGLFSGAAGFAQNDFIRLFPIHKGERPLYFHVVTEANTASLTLDIGLEDGDEDKFVAALAINATPINSLVGSLSRVAETAEGVVAGKVEGANPSDTADIEVTMFYVID
jgi:hypothetical protein